MPIDGVSDRSDNLGELPARSPEITPTPARETSSQEPRRGLLGDLKRSQAAQARRPIDSTVGDNASPRGARRERAAPSNKSVQLPVEVTNIIAQYQSETGLTDVQVSQLVPKWYSQPALDPTQKRLLPRDLQNRQVDALTLMEPLLGRPELDGTLRTMDVANGCGQQCDTCFIDAVLPSNLFSLASLERLFSNPDFVRTLQPDSFRIGSAGDIVDHPQAVDIAQMILDRTEPLNQARLAAEGKPHLVKIFTNYRKLHESKLVGLVELAERSNDRLKIVISLPNNRIDTVNRQFKEFAARHADLLQSEPYRPKNIQRHLNSFVQQHPQLLQGSASPELREQFVDHMCKMVEEHGIKPWDSQDLYSRSRLEETVDSHIAFLPTYISEEGPEAYQAKLDLYAAEDAFHKDLDPGRIRNPHVSLQDVREAVPLYTWGRIISDDLLVARSQLQPDQKADHMIREIDFENRGLAKTFLNPDGLWLHIYGTPAESHTNRIYAPITPSNLELLGRVPFNPDFRTPPNWTGGTGERHRMDYYEKDMRAARARYQELKQRNNLIE